MDTKRIIRKLVFITVTLALCAALVVLLVAAIGAKNHGVCTDYVIAITGAKKNLFIDESDIKKLLTAQAGKISGEQISNFNLKKLEEELKEDPWVRNATLYFDNKDVLHVGIDENEPIARVITTSGKSFYVDSAGERLPLSQRMSARVPVFTNFPDKKFLSAKDSLLLNGIRQFGSFILSDPFWMAQIEQVDITENGSFEMIPTVGNHIVRLGHAGDIESKFHRLFIFYQQVCARTGFNRFNSIDVEFSGQVVASRTKISKVDSIQLKKTVEKLLDEERHQRDDSLRVEIGNRKPDAGNQKSDVRSQRSEVGSQKSDLRKIPGVLFPTSDFRPQGSDIRPQNSSLSQTTKNSIL